MPPPPIPPVALTYSAPADAPRRPARLAVLGAADLVVALAGVILNGLALAGVVLVWVAGRMATTAAPPPVPLPLAVPVVPYHGDYVPTGGLAAADRAAVVAAVAARTPLSGDRQAMLERLLAAAGQSVAATPADVLGAGRSNNGPDGSGTLGTQTVTTSAGRLTLDNVAARFTPRDGSPPTTVRGDFVTTGTATAYVPQIIDAAIDDVQRRAARPLNARQASALAEIVHQHVGEPSHDAYGRPTVWANPPGVRLTDPPDPNGPTASAYVEPGVNRHVHVWIYANGRVATIGPGPDPDPLTGGPRVWPAPTPAPRPPPAVDDDLLLGSAVEYAASLAWAGLLGVAGVLLLRGRPVAPRLHGLYVVGKVPLTLASVGLMVAVAQDRVANAPYGLSVSWWPVVLTLLVQLVYPAVIVGVFASAAVVQYAHHQRIDARLLPEPWLRRAAALTPDRWAGRPAAAALAAGLLLLAADGYRVLVEGAALTRSLAFAPTAVVAVVLAVGGAAGLARRRRSVGRHARRRRAPVRVDLVGRRSTSGHPSRHHPSRDGGRADGPRRRGSRPPSGPSPTGGSWPGPTASACCWTGWPTRPSTRPTSSRSRSPSPCGCGPTPTARSPRPTGPWPTSSAGPPWPGSDRWPRPTADPCSCWSARG